MSFRNTAGLVLLAGTAVAGCHRHPAGQVVATVDGQDVTQQEVQAEAQAANVPANADPKLVKPLLAARVIDRKLVVEAATKAGINKSPDYLLQKKRLDENLLAQLYLRKQLQSISVPGGSDVTQYIADNPTLFAQRERLTLDQIRFAFPGDPNLLKQIGATKSMADLTALLTRSGIQFERASAQLDTGTVQPNLMKAILAMPAGQPFIVPSQGVMTASVITSRTPVAVPDADQRTIATNLLRRQNEEKALKQQLDALKASAKITYQPGFAPPPTPLGGAGAPANP